MIIDIVALININGWLLIKLLTKILWVMNFISSYENIEILNIII